MHRDDEELLRQGLIVPPEDFVRRTMARVATAPLPRRYQARPAMREIAQWVALAGAALFGAVQMASYMFGIWIISGAG
jgi:hypothetical protein